MQTGALSRLDEILPTYINADHVQGPKKETDGDRQKRIKRARTSATNLLLIGHLFGKFDADDPDHTQHRRILSEHLHDCYPMFAQDLVHQGDRPIDFARLEQAVHHFESNRAAQTKLDDDLRALTQRRRRYGQEQSDSAASEDPVISLRRQLGAAAQRCGMALDNAREQMIRVIGARRASRAAKPTDWSRGDIVKSCV